MMFRIISILAIGGVIAALARDAKRRFGTWPAVRQVFLSGIRDAFVLRVGSAEGWVPRTVAGARKSSYLLAMVLAAVLATTGFLQVIVTGSHLTGTLLLVHIIAAPLFALTLAAASLLWSHDQQVREQDLPVLSGLIRTGTITGSNGLAALARLLYWIVLVLALPLILSIILSLFPLFGTEGEITLIGLHGYSALALVAVTLLHGYILILQLTNGTHNV
jgi:hypothetical protein